MSNVQEAWNSTSAQAPVTSERFVIGVYEHFPLIVFHNDGYFSVMTQTLTQHVMG